MNKLNYNSYINSFESTNLVHGETDKLKKVAFSTLKLKVPKEYRNFTFLDRTIQIITYLPVGEKRDIIETAYQKAAVGLNFNPILFSIYFLLNIVYSYTNLTFTDNQRENEFELFDMIVASGLLKEIMGRIPESEKIFFASHINSYIITKIDADYSAAGVVNNGINAVNTISATISEKLSNVNDETIQALIGNLGTAVNKAT